MCRLLSHIKEDHNADVFSSGVISSLNTAEVVEICVLGVFVGRATINCCLQIWTHRGKFILQPSPLRENLTRIKRLYGPARRARAVWELEFKSNLRQFPQPLSLLGSSFMEMAVKLPISQAVLRIKWKVWKGVAWPGIYRELNKCQFPFSLNFFFYETMLLNVTISHVTTTLSL